jgi:hypothetical protein
MFTRAGSVSRTPCTVEGVYHVGVVDGREGDGHRVGKIQVWRAVLGANELRDTQLVLRDFGDDNPAVSHPVHLSMSRWSCSG